MNKFTITKTHHIDASTPDGNGQYDWYYEYEVFEFTDAQSAQTFTARSDKNRPSEAIFLHMNTHAERISQEALQQPIYQLAIAYLRLMGKTKITFLSAYGYALTAPKFP